MKNVTRIMAVILLFFLAAPSLIAREWTSTDGRKLQAEFVSVAGNKITLKRANGKEITFDLTKLSEADRQWANEQKDKPVESAEIEGPYAHLITGKWEHAEDKDLPYAIYGKGIDGNKKYPLIIGLHGKSDNNKNGPQTYILKSFTTETRYQKNPAILVAPLCYQPYGGTGGGWGDKPGEQVIDLIKKLIKDLPIIDSKRVYILGQSMGGGGTMSLLTAEPKLFAAGIVICGWTNGDAAKVCKKVPVWAFHGSKDEVVKPDSIRALAKDLKRSKIFKYTEFEGAGHGITGMVFGKAEVYPWLFSQRRK